MTDPLSVTAGVVGLLTAAAQVSLFLKELIGKARDAPQACSKVRDDVDDIHNVLGQLHLYLNGGRRASPSRSSLIMVDQVAATLASCITTFDELKLFVEGMHSDSRMGILDRLRWATKEKDLKDFQVRLEAHKSSLNLMLVILTCQKQDDAEEKVDALQAKVEQIYSLNLIIAERMVAWDMSQLENTSKSLEPPLYHDTAVTENLPVSVNEPAHSSMVQPESEIRSFAFTELLMNSRAYRRVADDNADAFSVMSAAGRTATWSMLSGLSLSEMSTIAILAIPVYQTDLHDKAGYDFDVPTDDTGIGFSSSVTATATATPAAVSPKSKGSTRDWLKKLTRSSKQANHPPATLTSSIRSVFGVPIVESIAYAFSTIALTGDDEKKYVYGRIPLVVAGCGFHIKQNGMIGTDIFFRGGHAARLSALQRTYDQGPKFGRGFNWTGYTVHDAAGLMLRYLKTTPQPVIPYAAYENFTAPFRAGAPSEKTDIENAIRSIRAELDKMETCHRALLIYLLDLMSAVEPDMLRNRGTGERLVRAFQPAILSNQPVKMDSNEYLCAAQAVEFLVEWQPHFEVQLKPDPPPESEFNDTTKMAPNPMTAPVRWILPPVVKDSDIVARTDLHSAPRGGESISQNALDTSALNRRSSI